MNKLQSLIVDLMDSLKGLQEAATNRLQTFAPNETSRKIMMKPLKPCATISFAIIALAVLFNNAHAGDYVSVDSVHDVSLHYEQAGAGPQVVVFVPGWTMTTQFFKHQLAHYTGSKSVRFITYDPRAHGRSTKTVEGANYAAHAADLKAFIDALDLENIVLGGWSWGGVTVYEYLDAYGTDKLAGVILMDQTPRPLPLDEDSWTDGGNDVAHEFFRSFVTDRIGAVKEFIPWMYTKGVSKADAAWMLEDSMLTPTTVASLLLYDGWMVDHRDTIKKVTIPQLHVVRADQQTYAEAYLKTHVPNAQRVFMGGHGQFFDHAESFNAKLDAFLAKLR